MKTWQACELLFTLQSPLSLGWYNMGRVSRTRPYLPGRNLWAAFTEALAHHLIKLSCDESSKWFDVAGNWLKENVAFSYCFFTDDGQNIMGWPTPDGGESEKLKTWYLAYVGAVEQNLVSSLVATAIDKTKGSAENATLHDTEVISHRFKKDKAFDATGKLRPVRLKGYLFIRDSCLEGDNWKLQGINEVDSLQEKKADPAEFLKEFSVGGDRTYGLGRLTLDGGRPRLMGDKEKVFGLYHVDNTGDRPLLFTTGTGHELPLFGPLKVQNTDDKYQLTIRGDIESLSVFDNSKKNDNIYNQGLFWSPGSTFKDQAKKYFSINYQGWLTCCRA